MPVPVPTRRLFAALATFVVAVVVAVGLAALPAHAAGVGSLVVRVVTKAGTPISGLSGTAIQAVPILDHQVDPFASSVKGTAVAGKPGIYRFSVTAGEPYTIQVLDAPGAYPQLYGGTSFYDSARTVSVADGQVTALDFSVEADVTITGAVTGASHKAAKGVRVVASRFDGSDWIEWAAATTNSKGTYSLTDLDPGSYRLEYTDTTTIGYLSQVSKPLYLGVGQTAKANATLSGGGRITSAATFWYKSRYTIPAEGVQAVAYAVSQPTPGERIVDRSHVYYGSVTGANGHWVVGGLPAGQYVVRLVDVTPPSKYTLVDTYVTREIWTSTSTNGAQVFTVGTGKTVTRHGYTRMQLAADSPIQPRRLIVLAPNGDRVTTEDVELHSTDNDNDFSYDSTAHGAVRTTDADGNLLILRMPDGNYQLTVTVLVNGHPLYQPSVTTIQGFTDGCCEGTTTVQLSALTALGWSDGPAVASPQLAVGATNTVTATANQAGASVSYEWMRDGQPIYGATGDTYRSTSGDLGHALSVTAFATKPGLDPVATTVPVGTIVAGPQITAEAAAPVVSPSGSAPMGTTLSASPGAWSVPGASFAIGWYSSADGFSAPVGTGSTYTTTAADVGNTLRVQVVASKPGFTTSVARYSAVVGVTPAAAPKLVKTPVVTYDKATNTYSVSRGTWSPATTSVDYAWTFEGTVVSEEPTLSIVNQQSEPITVSVAAHPAGHDAATPVTLVAFRGAAKPTVTDAGSLLDAHGSTVVGSTGWGTLLDAGADPVTWSYPDLPAATTSSASTYQWYSGSLAKRTAIAGATKSSFTPSSKYVGTSVFVTRSSTDPRWATGKTDSMPVAITSNTALVDHPATVTITGSQAHSTLSVSVGSWGGASVTRQWMSCDPTLGACTDPADFRPISKATASTYSASYALQGRALLVKATAKKTGYVTATAFSAPVTLERGLATLTKAPVVTTVHTGGPTYYSVSAGTWAPTAGSVTYRWYLDGSSVPANGPTSNLWGQNLGSGQALYAVVTFTPTDATIAPASTTVVVQRRPATDIQVSTPALHGSTFGDTLSLPGDPFGYTPSGAAHSLTYAWSVGGKAITGANQPTYTPLSSAVGRSVTLKVTSKALGYPDASYTASVILLAAPATGATPTVMYTTDAPRPGSVLTADTGAYPSGFALTYQWQSRSGSADFAPIAGAASKTLALTTSMPGRDVRVVVTAKAAGHLTSSTPSAPVSVQFGLPIVSTADPAVSGTGAVGSTLTASSGTWNTTGLSLAYQWMREGAPIPGATGATYVPLASSLGDDLWVVVTATRAGYQPASAESSRITVGVGAAPYATTAPKITGTPLIGSTLTVSTGAWSIDGLTFSYQWYEGDLAHPIDGAETNGYVPTDAPRSVFAVVTASRPGYASATTQSAPITIRTQ